MCRRILFPESAFSGRPSVLRSHCSRMPLREGGMECFCAEVLVVASAGLTFTAVAAFVLSAARIRTQIRNT